MGYKIIALIGKAGSGKDTILNKVLDIDKEISATGKEIVNKLNKKYGKELFQLDRQYP